MDSLMRLGFSFDDTDIQKGVNWFIKHQDDDGLWRATYQKKKYQELDL
jgi:hypothetical protein